MNAFGRVVRPKRKSLEWGVWLLFFGLVLLFYGLIFHSPYHNQITTSHCLRCVWAGSEARPKSGLDYYIREYRTDIVGISGAVITVGGALKTVLEIIKARMQR